MLLKLKAKVSVTMGMFDELKCSADIGELTNVKCQTKDIDNVMSFFWVDPFFFLAFSCIDPVGFNVIC